MNHFNGSDYNPALDYTRLKTQMERIKACMLGSNWLTLSEIESKTGDPASSISAQLRNLRKKKHGSYTVRKQRRGRPGNGLFEYRCRKELQVTLF